MIDSAQKNRNAAPIKGKMSLFCRLQETDQQNYRIDKALEDFHTIEELMMLTNCTRARINSHINYIENNCPHAICEPPYRAPEEKFRFVLKKTSSNSMLESSQSTSQDNSYLPTKEDFETAYRMLARPGEAISIDAVLDQIEINARGWGLLLKNNWRMITEKNIEIWSK